MTVLRQLIAKLWHGQQLNGDDIVALVLLLAMVASLSHLFTMLVTRWGDRHILVKSLLASLLVHTVCLLGLEVFDPLDPLSRVTAAEEIRSQQVVTQILAESEDTLALRESGNTPIPDKPTPPDVELARLPTDARIMEPTDVPDREAEMLDSLQADAEDVSQFEQSTTPEAAIRVDAGIEGKRVVAANDMAADIQTMLEQSKSDVYTPSTERRTTKPGDLQPDDQPLERDMSSGKVPQIDTEVVTEDVSIATATSPLPDAVSLPTDETSESIERRTAPLSGADPLEVAGLNVEQPNKRTMPARSFESRLPRPSRAMINDDPGERPVRQSSLSPQTPIPLSADYDEVRRGETSVHITDALQSAAAMVNADVNSLRRDDSRSATYKLRNVEQRKEAARRFGGTAESEAAVELSLQWLSRMQSPDGHWDAQTFGAGQVRVDESGVPRNYAGRDSDAGITALVTLSFLGAGYTHESGKYALNVDRAIHWLISQQDKDGSLAGDARYFARMYCHAMATYALAEALGMQDRMLLDPIVNPSLVFAGPTVANGVSTSFLMQCGVAPFGIAALNGSSYGTHADATAYNLRKVDDVDLRAALLRAVTYTVSQQDPDSGGWRYKFGQEGDISMFGWQMMSLKSASIAGIQINPVVRQRMVDFLNSVRQGEHGGLFGYRRSVLINGKETEPISPVMTAEALFCQQMLGYPRDSATSQEAVQYMLQNMPQLSKLNMYYWYYGTLAMYQYGGQPWEEWNSVVRDTLIAEQRRDGAYAGSWDPNGPWGKYGGRLYSTAISTLTLEVYYRLLPLYRMNDRRDEAVGSE